MSVDSTREVMARYFDSEHSDVSMMADDVVFTIMATGQEHHGPQAVNQMLAYFYHIAFDATAITRVALFGEHVGEFAGIPATGKGVRVPLCVVYDLENDRIKHGRVYFEMLALLQQLGLAPGAG